MINNFTDLEYQGPTVDFENRKVFWRLTPLYEYTICPRLFFIKRVRKKNTNNCKPRNTPGLEYLDKGMLVHHLLNHVLYLIYKEWYTLKEVSEKDEIDKQLKLYCRRKNIFLTEQEIINIKSSILEACDIILQENENIIHFEQQLIYAYEDSKQNSNNIKPFSYMIKIVPDIITESKIIEIKSTTSKNRMELPEVRLKHELQHKLYRDFYHLYSESIVCNISTGKAYKRTFNKIIPGEGRRIVEEATINVLNNKFDKTENQELCKHCRVKRMCRKL